MQKIAKGANPKLSSLSQKFRNTANYFDRHSNYAVVLVLSCTAMVIYSQIFQVGFYFDAQGIHGDSHIESLNKALSYSFGHRRIPYITYALNYAYGKYEPWGWHVTDLAFHITTSFLVYRMTMLLFQTPALKSKKDMSTFVALFASFIYLCHPLQTQTVIYMYQRTTLMAALFYAASCTCFLRARVTSSLKYYALTLAVMFLTFYTKSIVATLPITILFIELLLFRNDGLSLKKKLLILLPFVLAIFYVPIMWMFRGDVATGWWNYGLNFLDIMYPTPPYIDFTRWQYSLTQINVFCTYLRLFFLPVGQNLDYDYAVVESLANVRVWFSIALLTSLMVVAFVVRKKHVLVSLGIAWFLITLSVEFLALRDLIYEHRVYLPYVGWTIGMAYLFGAIVRKQRLRNVLALMTVVLLATLSFNRSLVWKNEVTLWEDVAKKSPGRGRSFSNLGSALEGEKRYEESLQAFRKAMKLGPPTTAVVSMSNAGIVLVFMNRFEESLAYFKESERVAPTYLAHAYFEGVAYERLQDLNSAIKYYTLATQQPPWQENFQTEAHLALGYLYLRLKQMPKAFHHLRWGLKLSHGSAEAHEHMSRYYRAIGDSDKATWHANQANL